MNTPRDDVLAEEVAAVLAVLAVLTSTDTVDRETSSAWGHPGHRLGVTVPGRHGWWTSGLPS